MSPRLRRLLLSVVAIAAALLLRQVGPPLPADAIGATGGALDRPAVSAAAPAGDRGVARIESGAARRESGFMVEVGARVIAVLPDDTNGSRHQRFLVELSSGRTLLVAHNIDLAPRADIVKGADVRLRGQYEWNEKGGVLHWTHHDPDGRHPGGWIEARGRRVE